MISFIVAHPFVAFLLSLPTMVVLVAIAWSVSTIITNAMTSVVNLFTQLAACVVILVRGHAPVAPKAETDDDDISS